MATSNRLRRSVLLVLLALLAQLAVSLQPAHAADAPCSDLLVSSLAIAPSPTTVGATTTIDISVTNAGTCATPAFLVQWRQDRFAATGPNTQVAGLAAGASTTVRLPFIFTSPGNFLTAVELDTQNSVLETNEVNNLEIEPITVAPAQAELLVTSIVATPTPAIQGSVTKIDVTVQNAGNLAAGAFTVELSPGFFLPTLRTQVNALAAGASTVVTFTHTYASPGDVNLTATVDSTFAVPEANELNNSRSQALTVVPATIDLVVSDISLSPSPVVQGRLAQITVKLRNDGNSPAGGFTTRVKPTWFSPDLTTFVPVLDPGQEIARTFDFTFPFAGTFTVTATVDSTGAVTETNEGNNSRSVDVVVEPPLPDLEITNVDVVPVSPVSGLAMRADITVVNSGNDPSGSFLVRWKPWFFGPDLAQQVNGLAVGESRTVSIEYAYPFPGTFDSWITVDPANAVAEVSESNNQVTEKVVVQTPFVDLVMVDLAVEPGGLAADQPATAKMTIRNDGNAPAGNFLVTWKPSPLDADRSVPVNGLAPGETKVVEATFTYGQAAKLVTTTATVDSANQVKESSETNNSVTKNIDVSPVGPDLVISNLAIVSDGAVTQGVPITVRATVQNLGARAAGPFQVEWNPAVPFELISQGPATLSTQLPGLAAGATTTVDFVYSFPAQGNFRSVARADAFSNVTETNEANNLKILNITAAPGIDVSITSFSVVPRVGANVVRGAEAIGRITVRNNGFFPARNVLVHWNPSGTSTNFFNPSKTIAELLPGASATVEISSSYWFPGTYQTAASVDTFNSIVEFNETNNTATSSVVVGERSAQFRIDYDSFIADDAFEDGVDGNGEWFVFMATLSPNAHCNLSLDLSILPGDTTFLNQDGIACVQDDSNDDVEDGQTRGVHKSITVTIPDTSFVLVGGGALEVDDIEIVVTGATFTGYWLDFLSFDQALAQPSKLVGTDSNHYRVNYSVHLVGDAPPPLFNG